MRPPVPRGLQPVTIPRRFAPAEVTTAAPEEPAYAAPGAVDRIWSAAEGLYASGFHPAIGLTILQHGRPILDRTIGHARGNAPSDPADAELVRATPDTPFCVYSASKAFTAVVIHHLDDQGLLHIDDRVADYIPEFARHGKDWVTLRHVLNHRAGLPSIRASEGLDLLLRPDDVVALLCDMRPESAPGRRLAYHAITGGFLLGEIVRRVTGKDLRAVLREQITGPIGLGHLTWGCAPEVVPHVAQSAFTGYRARFPLSLATDKAFGIPFELAGAVGNDPRWLTALVPSGNVVGTGRDVARFFELLRNEGTLDGVSVLSPRTIRRAIVESSHLELDFTIMLPIRYGTGFMLGARYISIFGPDTSRVFGHLGFMNMFLWADPARGLSVSLLTTGKPLVSPHLVPTARLLRAISRELPKVA